MPTDALLRSLAKFDRLTRIDGDQPRWPAETPGGLGGQWKGDGLPSPDVIDAIRTALAGNRNVFWRFHRTGTPEFSATNAFSALWGSEFSPDGSQILDPETDTEWLDADPGYSAVWDAGSLADYFRSRGITFDAADGEVVAFHGRMVGNGFDGEPLVIPSDVVGRMPWNQFEAGLAAGLWNEPDKVGRIVSVDALLRSIEEFDRLASAAHREDRVLSHADNIVGLLHRFDDKLHPHYPKGTPGGKGGEFMPKVGDLGEDILKPKPKARPAKGKAALKAAGAKLSDTPSITETDKNPDLRYDLSGKLAFVRDPGWSERSHRAAERALDLYRRSTFKQIGPYLRGDPDAKSTMQLRLRPGDPLVTEDVIEHAALITQAMEAAPLSKPVELWRGIYDPTKVFGELRPDMTGATWTEDSFISTSADSQVAAGFGDNDLGGLMRLHVPAGIGAVQLDSWRGKWPNHNREAELLLESGLRMRVVKDGVEEMGTYTAWEKQPDGTMKMVDKPVMRRVLDVEVEKILEGGEARGIAQPPLLFINRDLVAGVSRAR